MKSLLALALLTASLPSFASTPSYGSGACTYTDGRNGRLVFNKICDIAGGVIGVDGPVWWEVTFTRSSTVRVELDQNSARGSLNGKPAAVTISDGLVRAIDLENGDYYTFAAIEM